MSSVSANLVKWVRASLIKYFTDIANANSIPMFVEAVDERKDATMQANHSELRIQGPYIRQTSKGTWKLTVIVNILLTDFMEMNGDAYTLNEWGGLFMNAMDTPINIYKYGDDGSFIDCLRVKLDRNNEIKFFDFGTALNETRVHQAEIDATFEMTTTLGE